MVVRYIRRHRLEKKDPNAAISEPVKPIQYWVDSGAPEDVKKALVEGASWWNQAFEAAGFRNAFKVDILPDGADPMDIRYNMINWVHRSTRGWSSGGTVADPRTGEIIKATVTLGSLRDRQDYMIFEGLLSPYTTGTEKPSVLYETALKRIRQLSAHEVGHTLGLGHNYYDSEKGWISVMDYPHPLENAESRRHDRFIERVSGANRRLGQGDDRLRLSAVRAWHRRESRAHEDPRRCVGPGPSVYDESGHRFEPEGRSMVEWRRSGRRAVPIDESASRGAEPDGRTHDSRRCPPGNASKSRSSRSSCTTGMPWSPRRRWSPDRIIIYGMRLDNRTPTRTVSVDDQRKALDALALTLRPSELTIPKHILDLIPPRPPGYGPHRELFPRTTGDTFDPLSPATVAADVTIGFVLQLARAARLVGQHAVDPALPGLEDVIDRLTTATFDATTATCVRGRGASRGRARPRRPRHVARDRIAQQPGARDRVAEAVEACGAPANRRRENGG